MKRRIFSLVTTLVIATSLLSVLFPQIAEAYTSLSPTDIKNATLSWQNGNTIDAQVGSTKLVFTLNQQDSSNASASVYMVQNYDCYGSITIPQNASTSGYEGEPNTGQLDLLYAPPNQAGSNPTCAYVTKDHKSLTKSISDAGWFGSGNIEYTINSDGTAVSPISGYSNDYTFNEGSFSLSSQYAGLYLRQDENGDKCQDIMKVDTTKMRYYIYVLVQSGSSNAGSPAPSDIHAPGCSIIKSSSSIDAPVGLWFPLGGKVDTQAAPGSPGSTTPAGSGSTAPSLSCRVDFNPLTWLICPVVSGMVHIVNAVDNLITSQLSVGSPGQSDNPNQIFCNNSTGRAAKTCAAYQQAWAVVRNIALGLMIIAGLIVVIAQAMGAEIFDAYTVKKVLPRIIIAAISISLSWQLMQFFVTLSNDLGYGVRFLIYEPFKSIGGADLGGGGSFASQLIGGGAIVALGIFGLLSFAATGAVAVFIAFLVLVLRQIVIIVLIILAPIAIVAYVLPNTQNVFKIWWDSFARGLMMFPIIAAFIAAGRVFSAVAAQNNDAGIGGLIAFAAYFAPYFLIPFTFRMAGGALRTIGGAVHDQHQGVFAAIRKGRQEHMKDRYQSASSGHLWNEEWGRFGNPENERSVGKYANKAAMWLSAPHQNLAYGAGKAGVSGLRRGAAKIDDHIQAETMDHSTRVLEKLNQNDMFNDKAYAAIAGLYDGYTDETKNKLRKKGFIGKDGRVTRKPRTISDYEDFAEILSESTSETERIAALGLEGSKGLLTTLESDPETRRADLSAVGTWGKASHGFLEPTEVAQAGNSAAKRRGKAYSARVVNKATVLGQNQRIDNKAGYAAIYENGEWHAVTEDAKRARDLLVTASANDWNTTKAGAVTSLSPHIESLAEEYFKDGNLQGKAMLDQVYLGASQFAQGDPTKKAAFQQIVNSLIEKKYIDSSALSDFEKAEASRRQSGTNPAGGAPAASEGGT